MTFDVLDLVLLATALVGWVVALSDLRGALSIGRLPSEHEPDVDRAPFPRVSVVVPARDEGARIEGSIRRLLAQRSVEIDVVAVDDRSKDETGAILDRLAAEDARVRAVHVTALPPGWLGKCHALQKGGEIARGDWILFVDGDVWIEDGVIARAVTAAERTGADHVTIAPHQIGASLLGEASLASFATGMARYMARANRDAKGGFVGMGAFNLVRASAWRAIGGHTKLALEVIDDMKLGLLLERGGFRTRAYLAPHAIQVDWSRTLFGIVKALEKNFFAVLGYDPRKAAAVVLLLALFYGSIATGAIVGGLAGWLAVSVLLAQALVSLVLAVKHGSSRLGALLSPLAGVVVAIALVNSAWKTSRAGGVRWRETFYPLDELRRAVVR